MDGEARGLSEAVCATSLPGGDVETQLQSGAGRRCERTRFSRGRGTQVAMLLARGEARDRWYSIHGPMMPLWSAPPLPLPRRQTPKAPFPLLHRGCCHRTRISPLRQWRDPRQVQLRPRIRGAREGCAALARAAAVCRRRSRRAPGCKEAPPRRRGRPLSARPAPLSHKPPPPRAHTHTRPLPAPPYPPPAGRLRALTRRGGRDSYQQLGNATALHCAAGGGQHPPSPPTP
jgi:hypothetical protein